MNAYDEWNQIDPDDRDVVIKNLWRLANDQHDDLLVRAFRTAASLLIDAENN